MTVQELLDLLDGVDPSTEVRIAYQPSYPLECSLGGVRLGSALYIGGRHTAMAYARTAPEQFPQQRPHYE